MAQQNLLTRKATTFWSIESTYGAGGGTPAQIWPTKVTGKRRRERVPVVDESVYFHDRKRSLHGLKRADTELMLRTAAPAGQLLAAATPATSPNAIGMKGVMGAESVAAGSLVASGASATGVTVTAGQGVRFPPGTPVLVEVAGTLHATVVDTQATDALTFAIALPGTPSVGALVVNTYAYYFSDTNAQSLEVRHAVVGDANEQWQHLAGTGAMAIAYEGPGKLLTESYQLQHADWNDGALGYSTSYAANPQSDGFVLGTAFSLLQAVATTTRTHYPLEDLAIELRPEMAHLPETGGTQGTTGVMRVGQADAERAPATITVRIPADRARRADWDAATALRFFHATYQGTGLTRRAVIVHAPNCYIDDVQDADEGGRLVHIVTLIPQMVTSGATAFARASFVRAIG